MPALRSGALPPRSRRRSSHHTLFSPAKPGRYGVGIQQPLSSSHLPPRPISFAPNVTPVSYVEDSDDSNPSTPEPLSPNSQPKLFPPSETPAPPPARKRCPPGKRRSQGYIPRPPNAFMLFRADFVRQKHVPGSIEANHGSLSKIIGNCWRSLPLEEKRVWEQKAKHEKAAHKVQYPNYRFRPVHNKNKNKGKSEQDPSSSAFEPTSHSSARNNTASLDKKDKHQASVEEEIRCEEVTQLLLEGKKGEELARALRELESKRRMRQKELDMERMRSETPGPQLAMPSSRFGGGFNGIMSAPQPCYPSMFGGGGGGVGGMTAAAGSSGLYLHRRSSSVPLPNSYENYGFVNGGFSGAGDFYAMGANNMGYAFPPPPPYSLAAADGPDSANGNGIALPSVPFLPPPSSAGISGIHNGSLNMDGTTDPNTTITINSISKHQQRMMLGHRRSSSAGAAFGGIQQQRSQWASSPFGSNNNNNNNNNGNGFGGFSFPNNNTTSHGASAADLDLDAAAYTQAANGLLLQRDDSPLPDVDMSLFEADFMNGSAAGHMAAAIPPLPPSEDPTSSCAPDAPPSMTMTHATLNAHAHANGSPSAPGTNATTTPNGAFSVSELMHGLPESLGPLDTSGLAGMGVGVGVGVGGVAPDMLNLSPHDLVSPADSYWSAGSGGGGAPGAGYEQCEQQQMSQQHQHQEHQEQHEQQDGLGLEFGQEPAPSYEEMYRAEQERMDAAYGAEMMSGSADMMGVGGMGMHMGMGMSVGYAAGYGYGPAGGMEGVNMNGGMQYVEC